MPWSPHDRSHDVTMSSGGLPSPSIEMDGQLWSLACLPNGLPGPTACPSNDLLWPRVDPTTYPFLTGGLDWSPFYSTHHLPQPRIEQLNDMHWSTVNQQRAVAVNTTQPPARAPAVERQAKPWFDADPRRSLPSHPPVAREERPGSASDVKPPIGALIGPQYDELYPAPERIAPARRLQLLLEEEAEMLSVSTGAEKLAPLRLAATETVRSTAGYAFASAGLPAPTMLFLECPATTSAVAEMSDMETHFGASYRDFLKRGRVSTPQSAAGGHFSGHTHPT